MHPDFFTFAHSAKQQGLILSVNSNLIINSETLARLVELRPALLITSLDTVKEAHEKSRGPGFELISANIRQLRKAGIPVRLNCLLSNDTLPFIDGFIDSYAQLGCGFCFILPRPTGREAGSFRPPSLDNLITSLKLIEHKRKQYRQCYFSTSFHVVMKKKLILGGIDLTGCNAIQKSFNLNSDGTVTPCAFLYELDPRAFSLGNVRNTNYSLLPIWRNSSLLQKLRRESADSNERCINCGHFQNDCYGSCLFMKRFENKSGKPDPYCKRSLIAGGDHCYGQENIAPGAAQ